MKSGESPGGGIDHQKGARIGSPDGSGRRPGGRGPPGISVSKPVLKGCAERPTFVAAAIDAQGQVRELGAGRARSGRVVPAVLRCSAATVYSLCSARRLRHVRVGVGRGKILIPADAIDEYLAKGTVRSTEAHPDALFSAARR